jgi:hypothetical protein
MSDYDPLSDLKTAFAELVEASYKAELDLVDRYQSFTAELLRLSLLGIAVFGFLYEKIFKGIGPHKLSTNLGAAKNLAALGVIMFGISAAGALIFRYFATEGARFYIEALRLKSQDASRAQKSLNKRYWRILICRCSKGIAAVTLGLGGLLLAVAFYLLLTDI